MHYGMTLQGKDYPHPDEASRERRLGKGVDAPKLDTVKGFIRFLASASRGLIVEKPTLSTRMPRSSSPASPGSLGPQQSMKMEAKYLFGADHALLRPPWLFFLVNLLVKLLDPFIKLLIWPFFSLINIHE